MKPFDLMKHPAFGSYAAVARVCEVSREAVRHWKSIPPTHCLAIEKFTNGKLTRYRLRPDVFGKQVNDDNAGSGDFVHTREVKRAKEQRGNNRYG